MDSLRKPFLWAALVLLLLAFLAELGSSALLTKLPDGTEVAAPGFGIPYLAFLDGLLLFVVGSATLATIIPERIQGRVQSLATLVLSILVLVGGVVAILVAVGTLTLMVALLMAFPFGTLVYMGLYGRFPVGDASAALATLTSLKVGFAICLVLAHQRFLQNKFLVLLTLCSFVAALIVSFLHGLMPGFLVSITDTVAAIIVAVMAVIWALLFVISSIPGIFKAIT